MSVASGLGWQLLAPIWLFLARLTSCIPPNPYRLKTSGAYSSEERWITNDTLSGGTCSTNNVDCFDCLDDSRNNSQV